MTTIFHAATDQEAADVRGLMRDFSAWRRNPQWDGSDFEDYVSRDHDLDEDLTKTLGRYAPPHGLRRPISQFRQGRLCGVASFWLSYASRRLRREKSLPQGATVHYLLSYGSVVRVQQPAT